MFNYFKLMIKPIFIIIVLWSCSVQAQNQTEEIKDQRISSFPAKDWFKALKLPNNLQIQGFASQAFISTSDNDVFGDTDNSGSFGFTEAGLNALYHMLPRLQLSAQVLSRRAGVGNSGSPRLDFGFVDYRLYSHETNQFGVRIGRLKNPLGFYNDTRDVAFTRPSILLPQSIYFDRTRNLALSSDAIHFYGESSHPNLGSVSVQFGIGLPVVNDRDTSSSLLMSPQAGNLTREVSFLGRGVYESNDNRLRLAVSGTWVDIGYNPGDIDRLGSGRIQFSPILFSAQYNSEKWSLTSEYALRHFKYSNFNDMRFDSQDFFGESYYFQGVYRFTPQWEAILRYDVLYTDRSDRSGKRSAAATGRPAHSRFAKDITAGLRWNVTPSFMLRVEYHRVNGTAWLSTLDNPNAEDTSQHWNLYAVQASYRF